MNYGGDTVSGNTEIWSLLAPKKCNIFAWLALHNRLNIRERLARRNIILNATCLFGCQTNENLTHRLFFCPYSSLRQKFLITVQDGHGYHSL
jgi:hypothetical protein